MTRNKYCFLAPLLLLLACPVVHAQSDIMPVDQIRPGMTGIVRTTLQGTTVESLEAKVLGVM